MGIITVSSYSASILVFKHLGFQINIHSFSLYFLCFLLSHKSKQFGIFHLFINLCIKSSFLSFIYSSPILSLTMSNSLQDQFMFFVYFPVWNYIFLNFWILQFTISNLFAKVLAHWFFFFFWPFCAYFQYQESICESFCFFLIYGVHSLFVWLLLTVY